MVIRAEVPLVTVSIENAMNKLVTTVMDATTAVTTETTTLFERERMIERERERDPMLCLAMDIVSRTVATAAAYDAVMPGSDHGPGRGWNG